MGYALALLPPNARSLPSGKSGGCLVTMAKKGHALERKIILVVFVASSACNLSLTGATPSLPHILANSSLYDNVVYV